MLDDSLKCGTELIHESNTLEYFTEHYMTHSILEEIGNFYINTRRYLTDDGYIICAEGDPTKETDFRSFYEKMKAVVHPLDPNRIGVTILRFDSFFTIFGYDGYFSFSIPYKDFDIMNLQVRYRCGEDEECLKYITQWH